MLPVKYDILLLFTAYILQRLTGIWMDDITRISVTFKQIQYFLTFMYQLHVRITPSTISFFMRPDPHMVHRNPKKKDCSIL